MNSTLFNSSPPTVKAVMMADQLTTEWQLDVFDDVLQTIQACLEWTATRFEGGSFKPSPLPLSADDTITVLSPQYGLISVKLISESSAGPGFNFVRIDNRGVTFTLTLNSDTTGNATAYDTTMPGPGVTKLHYQGSPLIDADELEYPAVRVMGSRTVFPSFLDLVQDMYAVYSMRASVVEVLQNVAGGASDSSIHTVLRDMVSRYSAAIAPDAHQVLEALTVAAAQKGVNGVMGQLLNLSSSWTSTTVDDQDEQILPNVPGWYMQTKVSGVFHQVLGTVAEAVSLAASGFAAVLTGLVATVSSVFSRIREVVGTQAQASVQDLTQPYFNGVLSVANHEPLPSSTRTFLAGLKGKMVETPFCTYVLTDNVDNYDGDGAYVDTTWGIAIYLKPLNVLDKYAPPAFAVSEGQDLDLNVSVSVSAFKSNQWADALAGRYEDCAYDDEGISIGVVNALRSVVSLVLCANYSQESENPPSLQFKFTGSNAALDRAKFEGVLAYTHDVSTIDWDSIEYTFRLINTMGAEADCTVPDLFKSILFWGSLFTFAMADASKASWFELCYLVDPGYYAGLGVRYNGPSVSRSALIGSIILGTVLTAAAVAATTASVVAVRRWRFNKSAEAYRSYSATQSQYLQGQISVDQYRKAYRKYNRRSILYGNNAGFAATGVAAPQVSGENVDTSEIMSALSDLTAQVQALRALITTS